MIEKRIKSPRGDTYYWVSGSDGDGRCLVLLHGLSADHTLFDKQAEHWEGKHRLIVWDAPAHGLSRPYSDFSYPNAVRELKSIMDAEGVEKAVFIGQSMGGYVTQSFLLRYPERVEGFVGIDTCPYGERYYSALDKWWLRQMRWMSSLYPEKTLKHSIAKSCTRTEWSYQNMLTALSRYPKRELCELLGLGYAGFLEDNRDMEIACPLLILAGRYDRTGKVLQYCREWSGAVGLPLHIIEDAAHNSNADNPDAVNALIDSFIAEL